MKILYLDDDVSQCLAAKFFLRDDELHFSRNAADALFKIMVVEPDGVITDLIGVGGVKTIREIRGRFPQLPVVVYTGKDRDDMPSFAGDPLIRVVIKGREGGPLEAREALAEMRG